MPPQDDPSDGSSTLPEPDLNPLLNPLLGQNMGRWAEVYFTSAPEKREQAVLDLLRELQAESSAGEVVLPPPISQQTFEPVNEPAAEIAAVRAAPMRCQACGRENPASHRFCGMCGTAVRGRGAADLYIADLGSPLPAPDFGAADFGFADSNVDDLSVTEVPVESPRLGFPLHEGSAPSLPSDLPSSQLSSLLSNESRFAVFERVGGRDSDYRADHADGILDSVRATPYRVYLGIALAFVVIVLVYMGWRSVQAPQTSLVVPQAPPRAMTQATSESPTPAQNRTAVDSRVVSPVDSQLHSQLHSRLHSRQGASSTGNQAAGPFRDATDSARKAADAGVGVGVKTGAASRSASTTLIPRKNPQADAPAGNGGEELAMAQRYLNGTGGQQPDSAEAAKWLWKAIGKHNGEATLLLSDLYVKGDGVGKNCDQARVLLDAAAVRGVQGAAERLRHLQAFGCS
jgi:hypothetical protein